MRDGNGNTETNPGRTQSMEALSTAQPGGTWNSYEDLRQVVDAHALHISNTIAERLRKGKSTKREDEQLQTLLLIWDLAPYMPIEQIRKTYSFLTLVLHVD